MKKIVFLGLFLCFSTTFYAQNWTDVRTRWADSFSEWVFFSTHDTIDGREPLPEESGRLTLRFPHRNDWSDWKFEGDFRATIRQDWNDDLTRWSVRGPNETIAIRTKWTNDFRSWELTGNRHTFVIATRYNSPDEWMLRDKKHGDFYMYTIYGQDPRDWAVVDELSAEVSAEMRLAMIFVVLFSSTPSE
jgi:hypothetical protein